MEVSLENHIRKLVLNRPNKKNAISVEAYKKFVEVLEKDSKDDNVVITILTGMGDYFSSGNDFNSVLSHPEEDGLLLTKSLIDALIMYPKILIAVVNGPAIGIASTILALFDIVYCSDRASFEIPFVRLGLTLEGCSSYTYSKILGKSKAAEMLFLNHILSAEEAYNLGFVAKIIPHNKLNEFIIGLHKYGNLPLNSVIKNKEIFTRGSRKKLLECNKDEFEDLSKAIESEDFMNALVKLFQGSKL